MNFEQFTKDIAELVSEVSIVEVVLSVTGLVILVVWLFKTTFGAKALVNAPPRRNDMPAHLALIPIFIWIMTVLVMDFAKRKAFADLSDWQNAFADNLIMCLAAAPPITTILVIAWMHYARRLKGFGLNPKTIGRDLGASLLNLLTIMPVVWAVSILTVAGGKLIVGPQFEWPKHEELKLILAYPQFSVRALIIITTVLIVPIVEEMVFRGIFQTLLRSYITKPWPAVILASLVFILFHENPQHWPALFALSMFLGYAYEKSGSLFRSIFIHSMFNAMSVFTALGQ